MDQVGDKLVERAEELMDFEYHTASACGGPCSEGCVQVALNVPGVVSLRDTKGQTVEYNRDEWNAFLDGAKRGEFDLTA